MKRRVFGSGVLVAIVALSSPASAGGRGFIMHGGGGMSGGGMHAGRALPPVAGTWHVRQGRSFITGNGEFRRFGQTGTGFGGYGFRRGSLYGHTRTAAYGFSRYGFGFAGRRYGYGYGYGGQRRVIPAYGVGAGYGGYGGGYGSGGTVVPVPYGGYGGQSLASGYAETPLDMGGYGGPYEGGGQSIVGTGGPQVLVVHGAYAAGGYGTGGYGAGGCGCNRTSSPVVYRFGTGTYY